MPFYEPLRNFEICRTTSTINNNTSYFDEHPPPSNLARLFSGRIQTSNKDAYPSPANLVPFKGVLVGEENIAIYTIKVVEDPKTLNKALYLKPTANVLSFNDIVSLWEKKIGKTLKKIYNPEDQLLKKIQESPYPLNKILSILHTTFVKVEPSMLGTESSCSVEATKLYPEVKYTTVDEYLDQFV